jgi:flavorubredoxin
MERNEVKRGIYAVGANHWDRKLFDEIIPLPDGTSYNAYVIMGSEKVALIDTVDPSKENDLVENLNRLKVTRIDYVISNHAEQDHSGAIPRILALCPEAKVVTNPKCKEFLKDLLLIPDEKFLTINDKETLSLGDRTLEFIIAPWVHWPETMLTCLREERILFPCDLFGSHLATSDLFVTDEARVYEAAKRYYAEIMMPFRTSIRKHMERLSTSQRSGDPHTSGLPIDIIAPSHGPVYDHPRFILDAYSDWISDEVKNQVLVPYVSMHGSTYAMVHHFINALMERGIPVKPFNLTTTDIGQLAIALVDAATVVIASPTFLVGAHPSVVYGAYLVNALRPKTKYVSVIGSYGWGGKMQEQIKEALGNLKAELLDPVIAKGYPRAEDFKSLERLAEQIRERHGNLAKTR